jgi:Fe2+ or Zn2+ uptake regulation protein
VVEHAEGHLDADALHRLARDRDPRISLATVYRTLALLKRHGLVDELHLSEEHHHFEPKRADEHYHFVCASCGAVIEFSGEPVQRLRDDLRRAHGIVVQSIDLDVAGLCARCASDPAAT